jgi:hypothetical protein
VLREVALQGQHTDSKHWINCTALPLRRAVAVGDHRLTER